MSLYRNKYKDPATSKMVESSVWWFDFVFQGQRIRESTHQSNKQVARKMEAARKTQLAMGGVGLAEKPAAPTLKDFAPRFDKEIETVCAAKPATINFYKEKAKRLLEHEPFATARLDQIDEAMIDAYKAARTRQLSRRRTFLSPASANRELAVLRRMLRLAHKWKIIDRVPQIAMLRGERSREFVLSPQQEKLYLAAAPQDLRDFAILSLDTGLRVGEALSLEWPEVHLDPAPGASLGYLRVTAARSKNSKQRNVPLTLRAAGMLQARGPAKSGLVFHRGDGRPLYQTWLNQRHAALRKLLKLQQDFVPHSFRHTYGTRLGEAGGADAFTIMRLMGHSSVTVSQKYVHPTPETMERAVQRLDAMNRNSRADAPEVPNVSPNVEIAAGRGKPISH